MTRLNSVKSWTQGANTIAAHGARNIQVYMRDVTNYINVEN